ncbi:hypothetical protein GCM10010178_44120 [Lentzea flava]|uniref:Uncharacterized protein n=1 Tax=Lentzea flava TaxID=103732 RepID=A0ABQ2UNW9_9PSEU|nr:hypothetical protein GCM10010178_44120 [Lentzea flava]
MFELVVVVGLMFLAGTGVWAWSASLRDGKTSLRAGFDVGQASGSFELTRESEGTAPSNEVSDQPTQQPRIGRDSRARRRKNR